MTLVEFLLQDSLVKTSFFNETFLLTDTSIKVTPKMLFHSLHNVDLQFDIKKLT